MSVATGLHEYSLLAGQYLTTVVCRRVMMKAGSNSDCREMQYIYFRARVVYVHERCMGDTDLGP